MRLTSTIFFVFILASQLLAQCLSEDQHNSSLFSSWLSCEKRVNPFTNKGDAGHWIIYQFPEEVEIESIHLWNLNNPDYLNAGAKTIELSASQDSENWRIVDTLEVNMGVGDRTYLGELVEDFKGVRAKYIMLTILTNYGGECAGFSEIKFNLGKVTTATDEAPTFTLSVFPNPMIDRTDITISGLSSQRIDYSLVDMSGKVIRQGRERATANTHRFSLQGLALPSGPYTLHIATDEGSRAEKLVVFQNQ